MKGEAIKAFNTVACSLWGGYHQGEVPSSGVVRRSLKAVYLFRRLASQWMPWQG